jgi:hypothetical protein
VQKFVRRSCALYQDQLCAQEKKRQWTSAEDAPEGAK